MHTSVDILKSTLQFITKESIRKSGFLSEMSDNRLNNIVKNNVSNIVDESNKTKFKKNNNLGITFDQVIPSFLKDETLSFKEYIEDKHHVPFVLSITNTIEAFSSKMNTAKEELSSMHNTVNELINKYNIIFNKYTSTSNNKSYLSTILNYEEWKDISLLGPETTIIEEINKLNNDYDDSKVSLAYLDNFINKIKLSHIEKSKDIKQLVLDETKKDTIIEKIASASGLSLRITRQMFDTVISKNGIQFYISILERMNNGTTVNYFNDITETLNRLHKFLRGYNKVIVPQDNKETFLDNDTIKYNVTQLQEVEKGFIYVKSFYRYHLWRKNIILPNGKINKDLIEKAEKNNVSKNTLRLFVHRTDFTKGSSYFTIDNINNSLDHYKKMQANEDNQTAYNNKMNNDKTKILAFSNVLNEYCRVNKIKSMEQMIDGVSKEIVNSNKPMEYGFYKVLFHMKPSNVITKDLYEEFGKAFSELTDESEDVTKRTVQEVQAVVLTKYINKFMIENFC